MNSKMASVLFFIVSLHGATTYARYLPVGYCLLASISRIMKIKLYLIGGPAASR